MLNTIEVPIRLTPKGNWDSKAQKRISTGFPFQFISTSRETTKSPVTQCSSPNNFYNQALLSELNRSRSRLRSRRSKEAINASQSHSFIDSRKRQQETQLMNAVKRASMVCHTKQDVRHLTPVSPNQSHGEHAEKASPSRLKLTSAQASPSKYPQRTIQQTLSLKLKPSPASRWLKEHKLVTELLESMNVAEPGLLIAGCQSLQQLGSLVVKEIRAGGEWPSGALVDKELQSTGVTGTPSEVGDSRAQVCKLKHTVQELSLQLSTLSKQNTSEKIAELEKENSNLKRKISDLVDLLARKDKTPSKGSPGNYIWSTGYRMVTNEATAEKTTKNDNEIKVDCFVINSPTQRRSHSSAHSFSFGQRSELVKESQKEIIKELSELVTNLRLENTHLKNCVDEYLEKKNELGRKLEVLTRENSSTAIQGVSSNGFLSKPKEPSPLQRGREEKLKSLLSRIKSGMAGKNREL